VSYPALAAVLATAVTLLAAPAHAVTCANGVYRAGCAGPNGAVVGRKPYTTQPYYYHRPPPATVTCANGVYRAGCAGPNGAAVVRKPPY
jgi:hypothetical protein